MYLQDVRVSGRDLARHERRGAHVAERDREGEAWSEGNEEKKAPLVAAGCPPLWCHMPSSPSHRTGTQCNDVTKQHASPTRDETDRAKRRDLDVIAFDTVAAGQCERCVCVCELMRPCR